MLCYKRQDAQDRGGGQPSLGFRRPGRPDLGHTLLLVSQGRLVAATNQSFQVPYSHDARTAVVCREAVLEATSTPLTLLAAYLPCGFGNIESSSLHKDVGESRADLLASV